MFMETRQISHSIRLMHHLIKHSHSHSIYNSSSKPPILALKQTERFGILLSSHARSSVDMQYNNKTRRNFAVFSSAEPGLPPSGGPPSNIITWVVAVVVAVVIPLVNYKWGPTLRKKLENAMQVTEDVVEAVEKVAEEVEKVAEDISDNLPKGGKLREVVDFVENLAEVAATEAKAVDDFIDQVQEEEEKAEKFAESLQVELNKKPTEKSNEEIQKDDKLEK